MMKKFFAFFMAICLLNLTVRAGNPPVSSLDEQALTEKFKDLNNLENYVSKNDGLTLSEMSTNEQQSLVAAANIDALAAHQNPHKKGLPSFKDKPWMYIGVGALVVVVVGFYVLTGGGTSWNSRDGVQ